MSETRSTKMARGMGLVEALGVALILALAATGSAYLGHVNQAEAADAELRWWDAQRIRVHTGTTYVDASAADYTSATAVLTIAPPVGAVGTAAHDVVVTFDLDKLTTGFNDTHSSETLRFLVARKVDGTNWRVDAQQATTALSGTNANTRSKTLNIGTVGATEQARVYVLLSAEAGDVALPYVVTYRSPNRATFTDVSN